MDVLEEMVDVAGPVIAGKSFDLLKVILRGDVILAVLGVEAVAAKPHGKGVEIAAGGGTEPFGGLGGGGGLGIDRRGRSRGGIIGWRDNVCGGRRLGLRGGRGIWGHVVRCDRRPGCL